LIAKSTPPESFRSARSAEVAPSIRSALESMQDDKLVVDVILSIGLVASVLLIVSTVEFKGKIGSFRIEKKKVDPELLKGLGEFLGGLILPGRALMYESLAAGTAALSIGQGVLCDFPSRTEDAIASGIAFAIAGAVERQCAVLEQREGALRCLLSGGDAQWLAAALPKSAEIVDDLTLRGLFLIEREHS